MSITPLLILTQSPLSAQIFMLRLDLPSAHRHHQTDEYYILDLPMQSYWHHSSLLVLTHGSHSLTVRTHSRFTLTHGSHSLTVHTKIIT